MVGARREKVQVLVAGGAATALGVLVCLLIPTASGVPNGWLSSLLLVGFLLAAIAVSAVIGFIFGIPRARVETVPTTEKKTVLRRFEANSNLEQISDWLTKILVGAGLVQLAVLPSALRKLGDYLGPAVGFPGGAPATVAIVLYGVGVGFLMAYLWARLRLRVLLEESELLADGVWEAIEQKVLLAEATADTGKSRREVRRSLDTVQRIASYADSLAAVLWVDDNPRNNTVLVSAMQASGIEVSLAMSTQEALRALSSRSFGLVITDAGRREAGEYDGEAGLTLVSLVVERQDHPPVIVYTTARIASQKKKFIDAGATAVTGSPSELMELAFKALAT